MDIKQFQELIWQKGRELFREMPWRQDTQPYFVLVSELMLQQTQVDRVIPKFAAFIAAFPTVQALAQATLSEVLIMWSGLGYNRRAKFLHQAAQKIVQEYGGAFPETTAALMTLPGVGPSTAGAIAAYSFNQPTVFIETNVRTVFFFHFFDDQAQVSDTELATLVEKTVDREHPREWYWALMDYGTYLKRQGVGQLDKSKHYKKQAPLKGSVREIRGLIIKELTSGETTVRALRTRVTVDRRFEPALSSLIADGLVAETNDRLHLTH